MTNLQTLASYVPTLVIRHLMDDPSPPTLPIEQRFPAAILFADFSGFTALAEELAERGPEGAEELSSFLNTKFDELISLIIFMGGDIVTFAGDALLAFWPCTTTDPDALAVMTLRAAQCGVSLQQIFGESQAATSLNLAVRVGISAGNVGIVHIGGIYERWLWFVTGKPISEVMLVEQQAQPGQVLLSPQTWNLVKDWCHAHPIDDAPDEPGHQPPAPNAMTTSAMKAMTMCLETITRPAEIDSSFPIKLLPTMEAALRTYIPDVVLTRLAAGQDNWLADLRMITVLFINLPDMNDGMMSLEQMQLAVRTIQTALYRYEGAVNKFSVDEKGATLIAVFGLPPLSHEDDAFRGVQAAMAVQADLHRLGMRCAIGVTTGRTFCGTVGNIQRREYTILGDIVNLAARLMQAASEDLLCDTATMNVTQARILFEACPPLHVKGKTDLVPVYRPRGLVQHMIRPQSALVGRTRERTFIASQLQLLWRRQALGSDHGEASVLLIEGEAGMGKSRLIEELRHHAGVIGIRTLLGIGDAIEKTTPYYIWRRVFAHIFDLEQITEPEQRREHIFNTFASEPNLWEHIPLLNAVFPLELPETETTARLSGQALADTTRTFLLQVLELFIAHSPSLLIMENANWCDTASWSLMLAISQHIPSLLVVIATRPLSDPVPESYQRLLDLPRTRRLSLSPLSLEETQELICQRLGIARVPESITTLIYEKAQGNPFFTEEMTYTLRDSSQIIIADDVCWIDPATSDLSTLTLPDTIHNVIISRIDRLAPAQQLTLKVASVIGYTFPFRTLNDIYPLKEERPHLPEHLAALERLEMLQNDSTEGDRSYHFRHVITQEVVYHLMPLAQRRELHRALAEWYLQTYPERVDEFAPLLARHFAYANDPRAQHYYTLAANVAARIYANTEAIEHLAHALDIAHEHAARDEQLNYLYTRRGHLLELEAEHEQALQNYQDMQQVADKRGDQAMKLAALMAIAHLRSTLNPTFDPQQAHTLLQQALTLARTLGDRIAESNMLHNLMLLIVFTGGDLQEAIMYGEQSLEIARSFNQREHTAATLNDLAIAYRNSGQTARSQAILEEACQIWRQLDSLPMIAENLAQQSLGHFLRGCYDDAVATAQEAIDISESIGNMSSQANSQFMLGHVYMERGEADKATQVMSEAIFLGEQSGHLAAQICTRADLAWVYGSFGEIDHAIVLAELAQTRSEEHTNIFRPLVLAVLARLFLLKGDLVEAQRAIDDSYIAIEQKNETLLAPIYVPLADAELALVNLEHVRAITVTDQLLTYLRSHEIYPFRSEALYLKSQALLAMGHIFAARAALRDAQAVDEAHGARRMLWQILFLLSHIEARLGNLNDAITLRSQARAIVRTIVTHAREADLDESFTRLPHVRVIAAQMFPTPGSTMKHPPVYGAGPESYFD